MRKLAISTNIIQGVKRKVNQNRKFSELPTRNSVQFRKALPLAPCPGVNNGCQRTGVIIEVGNGFCQKKKGTALPSPVRVMLFYGSLDGAFLRGQQNRPLVPPEPSPVLVLPIPFFLFLSSPFGNPSFVWSCTPMRPK